MNLNHNRLHVGKNDSHYGTHFGMPYSVVPMHHVAGNGHEEKIKACFFGGLSIELTRSAAIELARRLPEAISHMPFCAEDIHDAVGEDA